MGSLRRQGVYPENLPTKKSKNIVPSDFLIAGLIGQFSRRYRKTFVVRGTEELRTIFGNNDTSTYYGWDAAQGFFDNAVGVDAKLYVMSHIGNDGSSYDGVAATSNLVDGAAANLLKLESAYETELDYSTYGNKTGVTVETGDRFTTAIKTASTKDDAFVILDSVSDIKVGDIIKVVSTGGGGATVYEKITAVDESAGKLSFSGAFHATANPEVDDVVTVPGFKIRTWRQSSTGIVTEVDVNLGKKWCTQEDEVTDYYVENVFSTSKYIKVTDLDPATAVGATIFPAAVSTVTYMASGANGTAPTTSAHYAYDLNAFDNDPVRMIANCESTDVTIQKAGETYCKGRTDNPKWLYNLPEDQTKAQLITIGNNYQRSDDVLGVINANWLEKDDPFATSVLAPKRHFPNVGSVMGLWCRGIGTLGIHWVPAVTALPIFGCSGVVGEDPFKDDFDRTDLCQAGVNGIRNIKGSGIILKSFYTPSTTLEFQFGNGIMMREFLKISIQDSLSDTENEPNSYDRIQSGRTAILKFLNTLWLNGSTGNVPEGETFGQTFDPETGESSKPEDHFQVQADFINNPQADIEAGQRDYDSWFTYPAPAASIKIGVGLMSLA